MSDDEQMTNEQHAAEWEKLADAEPLDTPQSRARAETYRRTAESFRLEESTGVVHCVCCLKPMRLHKATA